MRSHFPHHPQIYVPIKLNCNHSSKHLYIQRSHLAVGRHTEFNIFTTKYVLMHLSITTFLICSLLICGDSCDHHARIIVMLVSQEENLAQHDSEAGVGSNFYSVTLGSGLCWFKLLDSDTEKIIFVIFKYSAIILKSLLVQHNPVHTMRHEKYMYTSCIY